MSKKVIFIIPQKDFRDEELFTPKQFLEGRGITVQVAAKTRHKAHSKLGVTIEPDLAAPEIDVNDFSGVIFVGGPGAAEYLDDSDIKKVAWDFKSKGKLIGACCLAPAILAYAGVLISKSATAFSGYEQLLRDKGADYTGMPVQVDDNIITAKDASFLNDYNKALAFQLEV